MLRSSACHVSPCRRFFSKSAATTINAQSIVDSLRRQYELKKFQHITAAEKDKAAIHSMHLLNNENKHAHLSPYIQYGMENQDLYGLGYTSTKDV
jgi:hypothetical protein